MKLLDKINKIRWDLTIQQNGIIFQQLSHELSNYHKTLTTKKEDKPMRYKQINNYYILDTYTNKKLPLNKVTELLNTYEETLQNQRRQYICQIY